MGPFLNKAEIIAILMLALSASWAFCCLMSSSAEPFDHWVHIMMNQTLIRAIDTWRGAQEGVPSRAEAIRRLVEIALKAEAAKC